MKNPHSDSKEIPLFLFISVYDYKQKKNAFKYVIRTLLSYYKLKIIVGGM